MILPDPSTSVPQTPQPPSIEPSIEPELTEPPAAEQLSWWQVWLKALTHPTIAGYQAIINDPSASLKRALTWLFTVALIVYLVIWGVLVWRFMPPFIWGLHRDDRVIDGVILFLWVGVPVLAALLTLMFAIATGLTNIVARLLRGQGSYDQLIYATSAYTSPLLLIIPAIAFIPYVNLLVFLIGLYALLLGIVSVRAVHRFGWGRAIVAVLAPLFLAFACAFLSFIILGLTSGFFNRLYYTLQNIP
jgi:Yip1 domain